MRSQPYSKPLPANDVIPKVAVLNRFPFLFPSEAKIHYIGAVQLHAYEQIV